MLDKKNLEGKRNGLITTLIVHIGIILLMVFFGFTYLTPPLGDVAIGFEGFGDPDAGKNESDFAQVNQNNPAPSEASTQSAQEEDFATQDDSPVDISPSEDKKPKKPKETKPVKENPTPTTEENPNKEPDISDELKKMMDALKKGGDTGDNNKDGKSGSEDGKTDGTGSGTQGQGLGMFDFEGRKASKPGNLSHNCGVSGWVKVEITVNRSGDVIAARASGITTTNACLLQRAEEAAKQTKYSPNPTGPSSQFGEIKLQFKLN